MKIVLKMEISGGLSVAAKGITVASCQEEKGDLQNLPPSQYAQHTTKRASIKFILGQALIHALGAE